ncbi:PstS family phosphate ABC transporter substrate-binding protein [Candidatus Viridilinea mediisalina]|uniref:Phosphate-binding protein n=1 Tax=Candidatus Viridilinea mediisalina TaxID=2024553 RepID=A0A2A6RIK5_9CHLR|nr:PstS family phosphate ABC transporter substrate-binding protein [Candidatus Viridilinea mediisalina]PDW02773.1 phosphate-binding protein [Candidatus Viridilinea mediisalina]
MLQPRAAFCLLLLVTILLAACSSAPVAAPPPDAAPDAPTATRSVPTPEPTSEPTPLPTVAALVGLQGEVRIDGSSTVFPITEHATRRFRELAPEVDVSLGVSGSGGGFARFCGGETDISGASRPMKPEEIERCAANDIAFIHLPLAYDGISVVVSADNDWVECLTVEELGFMWAPEAEEVVTSWRMVRPEWPDQPLLLRAPGHDSGTYDYFTAATVGQEGVSRLDFIGSEDDYLIAQDVLEDPGALGFFGYAYLAEYGDLLRGVAIDPGTGCVAPSVETIVDGSYQPLSRPLFLYVRADSLDRPEVAAFVQFYLEHAKEFIELARYVPLPPRAYSLAMDRLERRVTGSIFAEGVQLGVSIEELLSIEPEE